MRGRTTGEVRMSIRRGLGAATWVAVATLTVGGCGGSPQPAERLDPQVDFLGVVDQGWADVGMADASVRLATELVALGAGENVVVSPLSLQLALAMLREGATGRVADEIDAAIGLSDGASQAVADLRAMLAQFEGDVSTIDKDNPPESPLVHIADSVFVQPGFPVGETFLERVAAYHLAQVFEADFAAGNAKPLLDAWVKEETGGLLTEAPTDPPTDTRVVLMDAVTFGASWASPFAAEASSDGPFTLPSASVNGPSELASAANGLAQDAPKVTASISTTRVSVGGSVGASVSRPPVSSSTQASSSGLALPAAKSASNTCAR